MRRGRAGVDKGLRSCPAAARPGRGSRRRAREAARGSVVRITCKCTHAALGGSVRPPSAVSRSSIGTRRGQALSAAFLHSVIRSTRTRLRSCACGEPRASGVQRQIALQRHSARGQHDDRSPQRPATSCTAASCTTVAGNDAVAPRTRSCTTCRSRAALFKTCCGTSNQASRR